MWPLLIVLYTFEFNITDYICTQHTNLLNSIIMNYSFTVITLGLLSSSLLLSVVLYLRNVKYKKELKVQSEEILRLDMEYRKLYSNLFLQSCSSQNKKNEMEIKELLRRKPFVENDWIKIEEFINNTQNQFVHRLAYNFPKLTQEDIHVILLMRLNLTNNEIANFNFREYYEDNKIKFDYKLRKGKSETQNAVYLMKLAGIEISETQKENL